MKISNAWEYPDNFRCDQAMHWFLRNALLKPLPVNILKSLIVERIMHKGANYLFNFGRVSIVLGDWLFPGNKRPARSTDQTPFSTENTQTISNHTGAALNRSHSEHSGTVNQQTKSNNGLAIDAIGDVSLLSRKISR
jgi:hypothetical protein